MNFFYQFLYKILHFIFLNFTFFIYYKFYKVKIDIIANCIYARFY